MQTKKVIDHIVNWLRDYCKNAGMNGFVVGVSGGIDSAVTSTLCSKTGKTVILLNMPIYQASEQVLLSERQIKWLEKRYNNAKGIRIDLTQAFHMLEDTFPLEIQDELTMANTRARMRMLTLYAFASHKKLLVVGTGNKIEDFGVGFFTKYGDGGVDISPIADLMKSEVYKVARELEIIDEILKAPPRDGLWGDDRTDESQLGATYPELEWAMEFVSRKEPEAKLDHKEKQALNIFKKLNQANSHKLMPIPIANIPDSLR